MYYMVEKKLMFEEFKFKPKVKTISVRITKEEREFMRKRKISPSTFFQKKLKELMKK